MSVASSAIKKLRVKGSFPPHRFGTLLKPISIAPPLKKKDREKQVAFYGGSFTAIHKDDQVHYIKEVQSFLASGLVDSIRVSTRPDALDEETLSLLKEYHVKTVELGVQSMIDEVLLLSRRGHCAKDTVDAIRRLKRQGFEVGLQLMIGLPADTFDRFFQTLDQIIELKPDFVRIHPTLVLKGAPLEMVWKEGRYSPLPLDEAVQWLKKAILKLEHSSIWRPRGLGGRRRLADGRHAIRHRLARIVA